jgi:trehalose/maltose hydrolase-like predicted phosphorylase
VQNKQRTLSVQAPFVKLLQELEHSFVSDEVKRTIEFHKSRMISSRHVSDTIQLET